MKMIEIGAGSLLLDLVAISRLDDLGRMVLAERRGAHFLVHRGIIGKDRYLGREIGIRDGGIGGMIGFGTIVE